MVIPAGMKTVRDGTMFVPAKTSACLQPLNWDRYDPQNIQSTRTVCFSEYSVNNWIQCTSKECMKWIHEDSLS